MRSSAFIPTLLAATPALALTRSAAPSVVNGQYVVGGYTYANRQIFDFSTLTSLPAGLYPSTWGVGDAPYQQLYSASNVVVGGGYLNLKVPGGQTTQPISSAEVSTTISNIKYASVRTVAILSDPAGVCNGQFFYQSGTQESDIEWLSDVNSNSNVGTRSLWFTNQDTNGDGKTYNRVTPPANPTTTEHEYRIDWTPGRVTWYVDGVASWTTTSDVPTTPGSWIFNNWSNGDKGWTAGPPATQANFKIKDIYMYYNTGTA